MSWVTWRQHRLEGAWALGLGGALAAAIVFVASQLHISDCPSLVNGYCFGNDPLGQFAQQLAQFDLYTYGLVVLPALAGAFIGCPLVAREIENGTHRLAWTQGVTRLRWLTTKLVLVFIPLLLAAAVAGVLEAHLIDQLGRNPNRWAYFDQQAPMTVAATFFALALGVAVGAVVGRSVPAMAVTLISFVAVRVGLAEVARPNYVSPATYTTHDFTNFSFPPQGYESAWWTDQPTFYDSGGHVLSTGREPVLSGTASPAYLIQHYQPAEHFWQFQTIESAILTVLALILVGFAIYWVTRRIS
jgi:hypothetical protein